MKTIKAFLVVSTLCSLANAKLEMAPPNFNFEKGRAVFVDFLNADYQVTFDVTKYKTFVKSTIQFENKEKGYPIFDMVDEPKTITLDGTAAANEIIVAPREKGQTSVVQFRIVKTDVEPGIHTLVIEHEMKSASYGKGTVSAGFFMSDIGSRGLLERYLPVNLEFDQVSMRLTVEIIGATANQVVFTNGEVTQGGKNLWSISFPSHFICSSIYFHVRPLENTEILRYTYTSIDNKELPVTLYKIESMRETITDFKNLINTSLEKFEKLFGPFPHPSLTVYASNNGGGMEYSGATITNAWALPHELAHSFFGRGVFPANGNAGWIDEAMATFVGGPYTPVPENIKPTNMSNHSVYYRDNDSNGYYQGLNLLGFLGLKFNMNGFLKNWLDNFNKHVTTIEMLQNSMEAYAKMDLNPLFKTHVFGSEDVSQKFSGLPNPHMIVNDETLKRIQ